MVVYLNVAGALADTNSSSLFFSQVRGMHIVVADDCLDTLELMGSALRAAGHQVITATNGQEALEALADGNCRLVISDWHMPVLGGLELCHAIRSSALPHYVYFILVTSHREHAEKLVALEAGIDDFMTKPFDRAELVLKLRIVERLLSLESREMVIFSFAKLAEARDPELGLHLERVQHYTRLLAEALLETGGFAEVDDHFVQTMFMTSALHDIGKAAISESILLKPARLTPAEFEIVKTHTTRGAETIAAVLKKYPYAQFLRLAHDIALTHHERYDGSGYPRALEGHQIPLCGRIMALADVYDALTSRRTYKAAITHDDAMEIIYGGAGSHFDPKLVEVASRVHPQFDATRQAHEQMIQQAA